MARELRLASFNIESLDDGPHAPSLPERAAILRPQLLRLDADVLCLQEVNGQRDRPRAPRRLRALDTLLDGTPYADFARVHTVRDGAAGPGASALDRHNLVVLSRLPIRAHRQVLHALVRPPAFAPPSLGAGAPVRDLTWDRPLLHAELDLGGRTLHVLNLHLRAPRAAFVEGQKRAGEWRSMGAWADGFFQASVKRAGQALEARLLLEQLFDAEPEALIAVAGDFNAEDREMPVRIVRGDEEDAANPHLASRVLVPADRSVETGRRYSVVHHGRRQMVDHILVSPALLAWYRGCEIHNEGLGDELSTPAAVARTPQSFHAPLVAHFRFPDRLA